MICHSAVPIGHPGDDFLIKSARTLLQLYKIGHATLQIDINENNACLLARDTVG